MEDGVERGVTRPVGLDVVAKGFELRMDFLLERGKGLTGSLQLAQERAAAGDEDEPVGPTPAVHHIELDVRHAALFQALDEALLDGLLEFFQYGHGPPLFLACGHHLHLTLGFGTKASSRSIGCTRFSQ